MVGMLSGWSGRLVVTMTEHGSSNASGSFIGGTLKFDFSDSGRVVSAAEEANDSTFSNDLSAFDWCWQSGCLQHS